MFDRDKGHFGNLSGIELDGLTLDDLVEETLKIKLVSSDDRLEDFSKDLEEFLKERAEYYGVKGYVAWFILYCW